MKIIKEVATAFGWAIIGLVAFGIGAVLLDKIGIGPDGIVGLLYWAVILAIYFIPGAVGHGKKHRSAIWTLNFLLGWTVLGWIGALVWALADPKIQAKEA